MTSVVADTQIARPGPGAHLIAKARWRWPEVLLWLFAIALIWIAPSRYLLFNEIAILALLALSIDLVLGYAGIVTLGQGAFFGLGAYTAGLMAKHGMGTFPWSDPVLGLIGAALVAGFIGFLSSFLVLRGSDLTRLMVTLGVALIVQELGNKLEWVTGGADGLQGVMPAPILGLFDFDIYGRNAYLYSLCTLFVLFVIARALVNSPFGLSLRAIKGNVTRARAIGIPVERRLVVIYTVGAAYAGIAGALLAQTTQFVSLDVLSFERSADALLILVFGGVGTLYGALIGAIAFKAMYDVLASATPEYWGFWLGLALVLLVLFARGGIMGLLRALQERFARPRAGPR
jgi:branched-chain amino acid transport system permease protein